METMTVIIDGKKVERKVDHWAVDEQRRYPVPVLNPGEACYHTISGDVIVTRL